MPRRCWPAHCLCLADDQVWAMTTRSGIHPHTPLTHPSSTLKPAHTHTQPALAGYGIDRSPHHAPASILIYTAGPAACPVLSPSNQSIANRRSTTVRKRRVITPFSHGSSSSKTGWRRGSSSGGHAPTPAAAAARGRALVGGIAGAGGGAAGAVCGSQCTNWGGAWDWLALIKGWECRSAPANGSTNRRPTQPAHYRHTTTKTKRCKPRS